MVSKFEFESQAAHFDARTELGEALARAVAAKAAELFAMGPEGRLVEIGLGTGEIGIHLSTHAAGYVGIDSAAAMVEAARRRFGGAPGTLLVGDANRRWPIADHSVDAVFFSRVLHVLSPEPVIEELLRVGRPSGFSFLIGRTRRNPEDVSALLRRRLHEALAAEGLTPKRGEHGSGRFLRQFEARAERAGRRCRPIGPLSAGTLAITRSARDRLTAWRSKGGIAGLDVSEEVRAEVLARVERYAEELVPDLEAPIASVEHFMLEGLTVE